MVEKAACSCYEDLLIYRISRSLSACTSGRRWQGEGTASTECVNHDFESHEEVLWWYTLYRPPACCHICRSSRIVVSGSRCVARSAPSMSFKFFVAATGDERSGSGNKQNKLLSLAEIGCIVRHFAAGNFVSCLSPLREEKIMSFYALLSCPNWLVQMTLFDTRLRSNLRNLYLSYMVL